MKREKRTGHALAALAAAVCLLLTLLPTAALAAEEGNVTMLTEVHTYGKTLTTGTYQVVQEWTYLPQLTISGDVTLIIPAGCTVVCDGSTANYYLSYQTLINYYKLTSYPASPGIHLPAGATLRLRGGGKLLATGGNGAEGVKGISGPVGTWGYGWPFGENQALIGYGSGGRGGLGGAAPGPGIGGKGASGGEGGHGGGGDSGNFKPTLVIPSTKGGNGQSGENGGDMGTLYVLDTVQVEALAGIHRATGGISEINGASGPTGAESVSHLLYRGSTMMYLLGADGAPGGGGGISGKSANIGGSGGGGGGGAAGNRGGAYVGPVSQCSSYTPVTAGGTGGVTGGVTGGAGGKGAYPNVDGGYAETPAVGGARGKGGAGGTIYVAPGAKINAVTGGDRATGDGEAAKVIPLCDATFTIYQDGAADAWSNNHIVELRQGNESITMEPKAGGGYFSYLPSGGVTYRIFVDNEDTGKTFTTTQGASSLNERLDYYNVAVTLKRDGNPITNKQVMLAQNGIGQHMLTLNGATGTYGARIRSGTANDTYQVFVDGSDSSKTVTATAAGTKTAQVDFCTMTVNVKLEGADYPGRRVELLRDGVFAFAPTGTAGTYTVESPVLQGADADKKYDVVVDGQATGQTVGTAAGTREAVVAFSNAQITLMLDGANWAGQTVSLTGDAIPLPATDSAGVYSVPLLSTNPTAYTVVANGVATDQKIQMSAGQTTATLSYYTTSVTLNKDGAAWASGATCTLNQGGQVKYRMTYSGGTYQAVGLPVGQEYDLMVSGSNSAENVNVKISSANRTPAALDYYSVTFDKNVGTGSSVWATQIVRDGEKPGQPAAPFQAGYTFLRWQTAAAGGTDFDFNTAINAKTTAYAQWVRPSAVIGQYIKCNLDGTVNGSGQYYRLPNLSVRGYPATGKPITTIIINLTNASLPTTQTPAGGTRAVAMDTATGNGKVTFTIPAGLSVAETETFLRNLVLAVKDYPTDHTVQITVYGATN